MIGATVITVAILIAAPTAMASHPAGTPIGVRLDTVQKRIFYVADHGEFNVVNVTRAGDEYRIEDSILVGPIPDADGAGGCSVSGTVATCPATNVDSISVAVFDQDDTVNIEVAPPMGTNIEGGPGNDTLNGGIGDDKLFGDEGGDLIHGNDGDDLVDTGPGDPDPEGFAFDEAFGDTGVDVLTYQNRTGGPVIADLEGTGVGFVDDPAGPETANVQVDTAVGFETLIGGAGDDELVGSPFADRIIGGPGSDIICGGLGVDTVDYSGSQGPVNVTLDGSLETDPRLALPLVTRPPTYVFARDDCRPVGLTGRPVPGQRDCVADDGVAGEQDCVGEDIENIIGSPYDDRLVGNSPDALAGQGPRVEPLGVNHIEGGAGDDVMDGLFGPDAYDGGPGNDTVTYENRGVDVTATIDGAANDGATQDFDAASQLSDSIGGDVEDIITGAGNDTLKGDGDANRLESGTGSDLIDGGGGNDVLLAASDDPEPPSDEVDDVLAGGGGDDRLVATNGNDFLYGGNGNDSLDAGAGDDSVSGGFGADLQIGGDGDDLADYSDVTTPVSVILDGLPNDGRAQEADNVSTDFETVVGGTDNDSLVGSPSGERLDGRDGNDILDGGAGPDELDGGAGADTVTYSGRTAPVTVSLATPGGDGEVDEADDLRNVENVAGGQAGDVIAGDGGANVLHGGPGNDRVSGAEGPDQLGGQEGDDTLNGDEGDDALHGGAGNDTLSGAGGADTLDGWQGNDVIDGGAGSDSMIGGDGVDTADYSSRTAALTVDTLGSPGDGERGENDVVNTDVESVRGGRGGDTIDIADGADGAVDCGGGVDRVTADMADDVASSCEAENVRQSGVCVASNRDVRISRSGVVGVRVNCAFSARGRLQLESVGRVRVAKNRLRKVKLGSKSFSIRVGRPQTVRVKASRTASRAIRRNKRMKVRAILKSRRDSANAATRTNRRTLTVRAPR